MATVLRDLRYATRGLARNPGFSMLALLALSLGISATTTLFSVVYGVLLRPLPYQDADRLVLLQAHRTFEGRPATGWNYSFADLQDWRSRSRTFESISVFRNASFALRSIGATEEVQGAAVSDGFFEVIDGPFVLGRPIASSETSSAVAVISEELWTRRFGRSAEVLGAQIILDGLAYIVVGVADTSFQLPSEDTSVWVPAPFVEGMTGQLSTRGQGGFNPIARLHPGVALAQAQADADEVSRQLAGTYPRAHEGVTATVTQLRTNVMGNVRPALLVLFAAVGLLLLVACANVASLLVARGISRSREIAIRAALGASRWQLARYSMFDAVVLATTGCAVGVALTYWTVDVLVWLQPSVLPRLDAIRVDIPVLAFAAGTAFCTSLVVGLVPAIHFRLGVQSFKPIAHSASQLRRGTSLRRVLVITQLAAASVLLVCATLLGRSLSSLLAADIGIPSDHVAAVLIELRGDPAREPSRVLAELERVVDRVQLIPGVESVALTSSLPPNLTRFRTSFELVEPSSGNAVQYLVDAVPVTPEFFSTLRLPLVSGRLFTSSDGFGTPPVMLVSAATARHFFGGRDPLGQTLPIGEVTTEGRRRPVTVVGVVGDVRYLGLDNPPASTFYLPYAQRPLPNPFVVARTTGDPKAALDPIRSAVAGTGNDFSIVAAETLDGLLGHATAEPRLRTIVLSAISGVALLLAAIGVYGVIAYSVAQRTNEIAVRMAVGATRAHVTAMIMRDGLRLGIAGLIIGLAVAYAVSGILTRFLYGVAPTDVVSFALTAIGLLAVAVLATYLPSRRATRVDPLIALRSD